MLGKNELKQAYPQSGANFKTFYSYKLPSSRLQNAFNPLSL